MVHSGNNGGKKWKVLVVEKYAGQDVVVFDSSKVAKEQFGESCLRPQRAIDLLEDYLSSHFTFDYEAHIVKVIGKGFNRPLFFRDEKDE